MSRRPSESVTSAVEDTVFTSQETQSFLSHSQIIWADKPRVPVFNKIIAVVNLLLSITLAISLGLVAHSATEQCPQAVAQIIDPYCE